MRTLGAQVNPEEHGASEGHSGVSQAKFGTISGGCRSLAVPVELETWGSKPFSSIGRTD